MDLLLGLSCFVLLVLLGIINYRSCVHTSSEIVESCKRFSQL